MALVHIDGDDLVVVIEGLDKLWALKSSLTIPLANVRGATADPGIAAEPMSTGAAVRTYNVLLAEDRAVAAALVAVA